MAELGRFLFATFILLAMTGTAATASNGDSREQLLKQLHKGGHTLVFRIPDAPMGGDIVLSLSKDFRACDEQRTLGQRGQADADIIGKALVRQLIPISTVHGSQYCRAKDSLTRILPNKVFEPDASLNDICIENADTMHSNAKALSGLLKQPVSQGNRVVMTHQCNVRFVLRNQLSTICHRPGRLKAGEAAIVDHNGLVKGCLSMEDFYSMAGEDFANRPAQLAPRPNN